MRRKSDRTTHRSQDHDFIDDFVNESRSSARQPIPPVVHRPPVRLKHQEDRRSWDPGRDASLAPRDVTGRKARVVHKVTAPRAVSRPGVKRLQQAPGVARVLEQARARFEAPRKTFICLKRKLRRNVLFALKRTGSGARSPRKRNEWSNVQC